MFKKRVILKRGFAVRQAKFLGDFGLIEFDPKRDCIPIFGSLEHRFTTTHELRSRPFFKRLILR